MSIIINKPNNIDSSFKNTNNQKDTDQKTYSLCRKIIEGIALVILNIVFAGLFNFELLRGDDSFLKKEYENVFGGRKIDTIVLNVQSNTNSNPEQGMVNSSGSRTQDNTKTLDYDNQETPFTTSTPDTVVYNNGEISRMIPLNLSNRNIAQLGTQDVDQLPMNVGNSIQFPDGELTLVELTTTLRGVSPEDPAFETLLGIPPVHQIKDLTHESDLPLVQQEQRGIINSVWNKAGSLFTQTRDMIFDAPEVPKLEVDAKFYYRVGDIDSLFKVTVNTPVNDIQQGVDPGTLVMNQALHMLSNPVALLQNGNEENMPPPLALTETGEQEIPNIISPVILEELNKMRDNPEQEPVSWVGTLQKVPGSASSNATTIQQETRFSRTTRFNPMTLGIASIIMMLTYARFAAESNTYSNTRVFDDRHVDQIPTKTPQDAGEQTWWKWICKKTNDFANSVIQTVGSLQRKPHDPIFQAIFEQNDTLIMYEMLALRNQSGLGFNQSQFGTYLD